MCFGGACVRVERAAEGVQPVLLLVSCDLSQHSSMQLLSSTMRKPCTRAPAQLGQTACQTPRALSTASAKPTWCNCRCSCQSARLSNTSGRAWDSSPNQLHDAAPVRHHNNLVLCVADHQQLCQVRCADIPRVSVGVRVLMLHKLVPSPTPLRLLTPCAPASTARLSAASPHNLVAPHITRCLVSAFTVAAATGTGGAAERKHHVQM